MQQWNKVNQGQKDRLNEGKKYRKDKWGNNEERKRVAKRMKWQREERREHKCKAQKNEQ